MRNLLLVLIPLVFCSFANAQSPEAKPQFHSVDSLIKAGEMYQRGSYDSALALYNRFHPGDTNYTRVLIEKVKTLFQLEETGEALRVSQQGLEMKRGSEPTFLNLIAIAHTGLEDYDQALEIYNRALKKYPSDFSLYYSRAKAYEKVERWEEALEDYKRAVELNPYHFSSHFNLALRAFHEEKYSQALMSLGYCILTDPANENLNSAIAAFDEAVTASYDFEPVGLDLNKDESFKRTDLLVKSYVALRDDYEYEGEVSFPLARQMHLVFSQVAQRKTGKGFWENYYQPFYRALMDEEYFEDMALLMVSGSESDYHKELVNKNASSVNSFVSWAGEQMRNIHNHHHLQYQPGNDKIHYFYHDNSSRISAIGNLTKDGQPNGPFTFYYSSGAKSSEGNFNKKGEREGQWVFYHPNGDTSRVSTFKKGEVQGLSKEFYANGNLKFTGSYKKGELNGEVKLYSSHGILTRKMTFDEGEQIDTTFYYYSNGTVSGKIPVEDEKAQGEATYFHEDASLASKINFHQGDRQGKGTFYFSNGQVKSKTAYQKGELHGPYQSFHHNGQASSTGQYIEGAKAGEWKSYNEEGVLVSEENFDNKGKHSGISISYDNSGRKESEFEYDKSEIKAYKLFDRKGELLKEGKKKWGKFYFENYNLYGTLTAEGHYHGDHKEGSWTYYDEYGNKKSEENYDEEGELHGESKSYYANGQLRSYYQYQHGIRQGYFIEYFDHGSPSEEGWYQDGELVSFRNTYAYNGNLDSRGYYIDGEPNGPKEFFDETGQRYLVKHFNKGVLYKTENTIGDSVYFTSYQKEPYDPDLTQYPNGQTRFRVNSTGSMYNGQGQWFHGNGQLETNGQYTNGYRIDDWQWHYPHGQLRVEGTYQLNEPVGIWKYYHPNGQLEETRHYSNGQLHGNYTEYYANGKLREEGEYYLGQRHGPRKFYQDDGNLNHVRIYDHGRITGYIKNPDAEGEGEIVAIKNGTAQVKSYFPDGSLARQYQLEKGLFQGDYLSYNTDGSLAYKAQYKDDNLTGEVLSYDHQGKLRLKENRVDGYLHGLSESYFPNGQVKSQKNYVAGSLNGEVTEYDKNGNKTHSYIYVAHNLVEEL